jgi:hypothetical protein
VEVDGSKGEIEEVRVALGDNEFIPPWIHLLSSLDTYEEDHEDYYAPPQTPEEQLLDSALKQMAEHALDALRTGRIPNQLDQKLATYKPWEALDERVMDLLGYDYLQRRLEFDVAREVIAALEGVDKRLRVLFIGFVFLQRARASETAFKYLRQASHMYLAGYRAEVFLMCGAVLEAAMADRFPDEELRGNSTSAPRSAVAHSGTIPRSTPAKSRRNPTPPRASPRRSSDRPAAEDWSTSPRRTRETGARLTPTRM